MKITVIVGSLRHGSLNRMLAEAVVAAARTVDPGAEFGFADAKLPLFNEDLEVEFPQRAQYLKAQIAAADGVLVVTPEYNHSYSGVIKNAIDWSSRPFEQSPWVDKPVGLTGASPSRLGAAFAQAHLRAVLGYLGASVMAAPELYVASAHKVFDDSGRPAKPSEPYIISFAAAFIRHVAKHHPL